MRHAITWGYFKNSFSPQTELPLNAGGRMSDVFVVSFPPL